MGKSRTIPGLRGTLLALLLLAACAAIAACGDDDDTSTPTGSPASGTATASDSTGSPSDTSRTPGASVTPSVEYPEECSAGDDQVGLTAKVSFGDSSQFAPGVPVEGTFRIINCGDNAATLYYSTAQESVMVVESDALGEVWRSDDGQAFDQAEMQKTIQPGEILAHTATWDQTDRDGQQVPSGLYKISFFSFGCGQQGAGTDCRFGDIGFIEITG